MKNKGLYVFGALLVVCLLLTGLAVSQSRSVQLNLPEEELSMIGFCIDYQASPDNYTVEDQESMGRIVTALNQMKLKESTKEEIRASFNQEQTQTMLMLVYGEPSSGDAQGCGISCGQDGVMAVLSNSEQGVTYYSGGNREQLAELLQEIVEEQQLPQEQSMAIGFYMMGF